MRYVPEIALPVRPFLPGSGMTRPEVARPPASPLSLQSWRQHRGLAFGFDLWERGFLWEAHEVWEDAWQLTAEGPERELLRGLIQLAAAGVQRRLGSPGAGRLEARARDHLRAAAVRPVVCGVWIGDLVAGGQLRWRPRSRDLPGVFTDLVVQPLECVFERRDNAIIQRTPGFQDYFGGRAYYDDAGDVATARKAAIQALAGDGPGYLNLVWEGEEPGAAVVELREGDELDRLEVLVARQLATSPEPPSGVEVRALGGDRDWAWVADFASELAAARWGEGGRSFTRWRYQKWRETATLWGGDFFAAFDGEAAVGSLGIIDCGAMLRYQDVQVAESHRRRGIARYLCAHAFQRSGAGPNKPAVIIAEHGSIAEHLYRQLGFERCTTQHYLRWLHEG